MDDATSSPPAPVDRVIRLEVRSDLFETRLDRIEDKLDQIIRRLAATPTRIDLLGAFVAAMAVLSIVFAGLGWLETRADRLQPDLQAAARAPAPIIIQLPPYPAAPGASASKRQARPPRP